MHKIILTTERHYRTTDELEAAIKADSGLSFDEKQQVLDGAGTRVEYSKGDGTNPDKFYINVELGEDEPEPASEETNQPEGE